MLHVQVSLIRRQSGSEVFLVLGKNHTSAQNYGTIINTPSRNPFERFEGNRLNDKSFEDDKGDDSRWSL